jgi:predicted transcriptional regulator
MIDEKEKKRSLTPIKADLISRLIENNVDKNKVSELIGIKRMFLNKRIEEIKKLREICENLERVSNKHEK